MKHSDIPINADPALAIQAAAGDAPAEKSLLSFAALLNIPLRRLRLIVFVAVMCAAVVVGLGVVLAKYTAESEFTPASGGGGAQGLLGLAAQFGFATGSLAGGQSVDFYVDLLQSRDLLKSATETKYRFATSAGGQEIRSGDLLQLYKVGGRDHEDSVTRAIEILRKRMTVEADETGNTVTVRVSARWPGLAEQVTRVLIDGVNRFNVAQMQSQASAERRFVEARVAEARTELDSAESRLRRFLEENRTFQSSPRLVFEQQRLQAWVDLRQQVYTTLAQSLEQARISEVRDTPVITIVEVPEGSAVRHRHIIRNTFLGLMLGALFGIGLAFISAYVHQERLRAPEDYLEFANLRRSALQQLGLKRMLGRGQASP